MIRGSQEAKAIETTELIEIRWHGRGGQGAVTSAELLAQAAINEGKYAQGFPSFGPERRGAPVVAFNRVSANKPIRNRSAIVSPDIVVVLDPGLQRVVDVTSGLKKGGLLVINTDRAIKDVKADIDGEWRVATVDALKIAREVLGVPIVNTAMVGALLKATNVIELESLSEPLRQRFSLLAEKNIKAVKRAFEETIVS
ncbi:MAG: pyruvate ferredoxin oxidoreductase subunit gamma [Dehalococcoidales bacterium]|nr:pyruvate ferredoxin oxidoreductase subunit gamma [Dehalococcoidales bacterium]